MLIASCTFILHTSRFQASFRVKFEFNDDVVDGGGEILQQHGKVYTTPMSILMWEVQINSFRQLTIKIACFVQ